MKKMKKIYTILSLLSCMMFGYAQTYVEAPATLNTSTQLRLPNGTASDVFVRGAYIVRATELGSLPSGTSITNLGFRLVQSTSPLNDTVSGTIKIYLGNTASTTYSLNSTWATAISGLTLVYNGPFNLLDTTGTIDKVLNTAFAYTGAGIYVAYDYKMNNAANASLNPATWDANNSLAGSCFVSRSATVAPATLPTAGSTFRPVTRFGFNNTFTNEIGVISIFAYGKLAAGLSGADQRTITASVKNNGTVAKTNIIVSVNVTGANTFTTADTIPALNPGDTGFVNFSGFNPSNIGQNIITVSVPADQNNANNNLSAKQNVSCNTVGVSDTVLAGGSVGFNTGSGVLANLYQMGNRPSKVLSARIFISNSVNNTGKKVRAIVVNSQNQIVAKSNMITLAASDINTLKAFAFSKAPLILADSNYFVGLLQTADTITGYFPLGYNASSTEFVHFSLDSATGAITGASKTLGRWLIEPVLQQVTVIPSIDSACNNGAPVTLVGYPTGGTFGGTGVTGNSFNPALGLANANNTITYNITPPANGCASNGNINVYVKTCSVGLTNIETSAFEVFPNPSNGVFKINQSSAIDAEVNVFDLTGKTILNKTISTLSETIDLSKQADGMYFLQVKQNGVTKTMKITKN
jgi:Secretion system C-terminal sorting domain/CARDB